MSHRGFARGSVRAASLHALVHNRLSLTTTNFLDLTTGGPGLAAFARPGDGRFLPPPVRSRCPRTDLHHQNVGVIHTHETRFSVEVRTKAAPAPVLGEETSPRGRVGAIGCGAPVRLAALAQGRLCGA